MKSTTKSITSAEALARVGVVPWPLQAGELPRASTAVL